MGRLGAARLSRPGQVRLEIPLSETPPVQESQTKNKIRTTLPPQQSRLGAARLIRPGHVRL